MRLACRGLGRHHFALLQRKKRGKTIFHPDPRGGRGKTRLMIGKTSMMQQRGMRVSKIPAATRPTFSSNGRVADSRTRSNRAAPRPNLRHLTGSHPISTLLSRWARGVIALCFLLSSLPLFSSLAEWPDKPRAFVCSPKMVPRRRVSSSFLHKRKNGRLS